jgi:hypothetical protein
VADLQNRLPEGARAVARDLNRTTNRPWRCEATENRMLRIACDGRTVDVNPENEVWGKADSRWVDAVAAATQKAVAQWGGDWPRCPTHPGVTLRAKAGDWRCPHAHTVATIGDLQPDRGKAAAALTAATETPLGALSSWWYSPSMWSVIGESLAVRPTWGGPLRVLTGHWTHSRSLQQKSLVGLTLWAATASVRGGAFQGVSLPYVPLYITRVMIAAVLFLVSFLSIDIIVLTPLVLAWTGSFTRTQAADAIFVCLAGHALLSNSFARLMVPASARDHIDDWVAENRFAGFSRPILPAAGVLWALGTLPRFEAHVEGWALRHGTDPLSTLVVVYAATAALVTGVSIAVRGRYRVGERDTDDLFREVFWVLVAVVVALTPAVLQLSWAPTVMGAVAAPLIITRTRITRARATSTAGGGTYWAAVAPELATFGTLTVAAAQPANGAIPSRRPVSRPEARPKRRAVTGPPAIRMTAPRTRSGRPAPGVCKLRTSPRHR